MSSRRLSRELGDRRSVIAISRLGSRNRADKGSPRIILASNQIRKISLYISLTDVLHLQYV